MESKKVTLKKPVKREGESPVTELSFREPTGKDLKVLDKTKGHIAGTIALAARVCEQGLSPEDFDAMPASDLMPVMECLGEWIAPETTLSGE